MGILLPIKTFSCHLLQLHLRPAADADLQRHRLGQVEIRIAAVPPLLCQAAGLPTSTAECNVQGCGRSACSKEGNLFFRKYIRFDIPEAETRMLCLFCE